MHFWGLGAFAQRTKNTTNTGVKTPPKLFQKAIRHEVKNDLENRVAKVLPWGRVRSEKGPGKDPKKAPKDIPKRDLENHAPVAQAESPVPAIPLGPWAPIYE